MEKPDSWLLEKREKGAFSVPASTARPTPEAEDRWLQEHAHVQTPVHIIATWIPLILALKRLYHSERKGKEREREKQTDSQTDKQT